MADMSRTSVQMAGDGAIDHLHRPDFHNPVTFGELEPRCFQIEYDLSHAAAFGLSSFPPLRRQRAL